MFAIKIKTKYVIERDYDSKIWQIAGEFENSPEDFSDGQISREIVCFSNKEANRLNMLITEDSTDNIGIVKTKMGLRFITF